MELGLCGQAGPQILRHLLCYSQMLLRSQHALRRGQIKLAVKHAVNVSGVTRRMYGDFQHPDLNSHNVLCTRCRNINLLPIDYAFRPRLRGRLTLG